MKEKVIFQIRIHEDENRESLTTIRFDPNFGLHDDIEQTKEEFRDLNDYPVLSLNIELLQKMFVPWNEIIPSTRSPAV
ncbi:unnamed protein product [Adineta steineri]|uniref:Uncharacterized protein n=1 Tax=Adineta steineri TaxID=433720 RepID=A0A814M659_9BILA|nr:unnamed protein product [Adineta steineri]CAF3916341.1 unnamed protein product [Adineta steineri]